MPPKMSLVCPLNLIRKCRIKSPTHLLKAGPVRCHAQGDPGRTQEKHAPTLLELASTCSGRPANLSTYHRPLICHNSLWQVHVLPSTQERVIKEKKQHKVLLSKKVVLLSGGGAHAEPPAALQTDWRPGQAGLRAWALKFKGLDCRASSNTCKLGDRRLII